MPRPDLDELERRVARTGATVDNVSDLLALARELTEQLDRAILAAQQERRGHERSLVRMGVLTSDAAGNLQAKHPDGGSDADARRRELEADLDAARAELAQRGELVGWVVVRPDATRRFCVPNIRVYPSPETAAAAADLKRARYPQVAYFVAEVRALAGEGSDGE